MTPLETVAVRSLLWAGVGAAAAVPLLIVPGVEDPLLPGVLHLIALAGFAVALVFHLAPLGEPPWFGGTSLGESGRTALTGIVIVAVVAAATAAVTAPTALALRYDASLQFLVLLVAVTTTGQAAAMALGGRRRFGGPAGLALAAVPAVVGIGCFWRYLSVVGTGPGGSWLVDGARFGAIVLPWQAALTVIAVLVFSLGTRARA